ncbi:MAG TPA: PfkB family carbohydrate kinase, partial [Rubricoccaceae bacterium]
PTGAGDTFLGGFAGHLLRINAFDAPAMRQAIVVGSALASFVVEAFGTDSLAAVTPADLDERLDVFRRLSAVPDGIEVG